MGGVDLAQGGGAGVRIRSMVFRVPCTGPGFGRGLLLMQAMQFAWRDFSRLRSRAISAVEPAANLMRHEKSHDCDAHHLSITDSPPRHD